MKSLRSGHVVCDDQVRGIETVTTYDPSTQEFIIDTPCESAQKYWIGSAAKVIPIFNVVILHLSLKKIP